MEQMHHQARPEPSGGTSPGSPSPRDAYARWTGDCSRAGWQPHGPAARAESVPLADALGRVTAQPVTARWPSPQADCAAMDGIAINAEKSGVGGAEGPRTKVILPGEFAWIDTGDPLPPGADTVIMREHVTLGEAGAVLVSGAPGTGPGHHVRKRGEDFDAGEVLIPAGHRLDPSGLAVAAAAGRTAIAVAARPAVTIVPTGDEIVPAGRLPEGGEIIDSNSVYLAARCSRAGALATVTGVVPDDPDMLAAELRRAAADADLVLVIAGSSRGRGDYTASVLAQVGGLTVAGVAVRPGHPAILGYTKFEAPAAPPSAGAVPVVGLPGYPLATAVAFELFAAPLLAGLVGEVSRPARVTARLDRDWTSSPDVEDWVPVSLSADGIATPAGHGASSTSKLARSSAWWRVPAGHSRIAAGTEIEILPFP